jgi:peptidoglycan/xylan/chitin deacetylase (PgdA/CDA1 family)
VNRQKRRLARVLRALGIDTALFGLQRALLSPFVRCLNYHDVPPDRADDFERQLRFYTRNFEPVDYEGLMALHDGRWRASKPGLILSFDDGLRSHADVVAPLLERHGFVGWFMVPGGFVDAGPEDQRAFARDHQISHADFNYGDPRIAITWDDVQRLGRRHVIRCHTWDHRRLSADLRPEELEVQIRDARRRLEKKLGLEVPVFAWVGGEEWSYSSGAARAIWNAGFRCSFMTNNRVIQQGSELLQLQRTNVEASDPDAVVRFQVSGLLDLLYTPKRLRVNKLTASTPS